MPVPEKRAGFLQDSEVRNIRNIITKGSAQSAKHSGGAGVPASALIGAAGSDSDGKSEEIFSCLNRLEERIDMLDAQMKRHFGNSKLVESEINMLVSDKWESLSKETDECLTRMMGEMQDLRDIVIGLRSAVRGMEK